MIDVLSVSTESREARNRDSDGLVLSPLMIVVAIGEAGALFDGIKLTPMANSAKQYPRPPQPSSNLSILNAITILHLICRKVGEAIILASHSVGEAVLTTHNRSSRGLKTRMWWLVCLDAGLMRQ